ncbi:MAG: diguanylate cyclase [Burkholderiaceae bacterium]|nr:MAG: diguanylate cyclase [Burkholderiaceae bacterium]
MTAWNPAVHLPELVDFFDAGVFIVDLEHRVVLWNKFMAQKTGRSAAEVIGKPLFELFPDLPQKWLEKKLDSVATLKNYSFTSWEQRPWLFQFSHNRPMTGGIDYMRQNCVFVPLKGPGSEEVEFVSVTIFDATDNAIYQTQLAEALKTLEESSITDGLTKIFNRRHLTERMNGEFSRAVRGKTGLALIMFDLDHFKKINDTYGHLGGDEVLKEVAKRVKDLLRTQDVFGRYGGEEFCILLPDTNLEGGVIVADRIRSAICAEPMQFGNQQIPVSASLGVTIYVHGMPGHETMVQLADEALYECKRNGRNCVSSKLPEASATATPIVIT